jgi:hypothetical protein
MSKSDHEGMGTIGKESRKPGVFRAVVIGLGVCVMGAMGAAGGCVQPPTQLQPLPGPSGGSSSGTTSGGGADNPARDAFNALQGELMAACGTCHDIAGLADTPFLAGPDRYQSFVSWPGIVATTPESSILLTHAMTGKGHVGTNLDSPALVDTLLPKVKAWLAEEAKTFIEPPQQVPHVEPFAPIIGFNAVYLEPLGKDFIGMAVTFSADLISETTLELSNIEVHPTSKAGVHMVHPLFVMHPVSSDPIPDPVDSFSNIDQSFEIGKSGTLGPGTVVLVNWPKDARLSLAFETIEVILPPDMDAGDGGGDPNGGCKNVQAFIDNARVPFQQRCFGCHGGGNGQASAALDMSDLVDDAAKACAQAKNRVNPGDPPASQIFVTTNPNGNAAHPYKFGGSADAFNTFRGDVVNWIAAEQ